ncbi:PepSY-associated TM helix domain-containing protein [Stutzerimonas kirkiae]|uniref:PepSY-associated TM helix domain-containing protein n=1 Tax=Stutzerimonas kirkiae TaxID=2211392 RepID=UPI0010384EFB|nr:PepSY-associated TM helix domain-containing protein [Stutzerimonas kirkiae]TBV08147.1 peptidase [Stutzerimonas kirkiae]
MKEGFRQSMAWLHTWTGLVVGWVLFFVFVTGTAGYVAGEISRWMRPELPLAERLQDVDRGLALELALSRLERDAVNAKSWNIELPHYDQGARRVHGLEISWEEMPERGQMWGRYNSEELDAGTGEVKETVEARNTGGGTLLYRMHYALHYIPYDVAIRLVGICTMLMLLAILSGVITHKKIFKDFFTFRPGKGQRSWLDAHNIISVMALPFFLMITYSGLMFFPSQYMPAGIGTVYGTSDADRNRFYDELFERDRDEVFLPVAKPGVSLHSLLEKAEAEWGAGNVASLSLRHPQKDGAYVELHKVSGGQIVVYDAPSLRFSAVDGQPMADDHEHHAVLETRGVILALHEGLFADWWLRWLYFLSGLLGCGMIGTGLVLWTVKRRGRHLKKDASSRFDAAGLRLVEILNAGTIVGLPVAIAAYFWANRLLPVDMADRAAWEAHSLFVVWGWTFVYAALRPLKKAWLEILWIAVAAYALLPLLNALTTDKHLGVTLPYGDWVLAGFDLTMLALAALFAYAAVKLRTKWLKAEAAARERKPAKEPAVEEVVAQ